MVTTRVLNIDVLNLSKEDLLRMLERGVIYTPNMDHFVLLQKDHEFYDAYKDSEYIVLDSQVVFLLYALRKNKFREKISGSDLFPSYCKHHRGNADVRIFVLGGLGDVAERVREKINSNAGREIIVGALSPSLGFVENPSESSQAIQHIANSRANVLAVGLGTPQQEKWIYRYKSTMPNVKIFMGVGATFDFMVGKQKRAPAFVQKMGLEWFYRLVKQPKRLAKRYLFDDMQFFYYYVLDLLNVYKDPFAK